MEQMRFHITISAEAVARIDAEAIRQSQENQYNLTRGAILGQLVMRHLPHAEPQPEQPKTKTGRAKYAYARPRTQPKLIPALRIGVSRD
jgi:hypothetical protein